MPGVIAMRAHEASEVHSSYLIVEETFTPCQSPQDDTFWWMNDTTSFVEDPFVGEDLYMRTISQIRDFLDENRGLVEELTLKKEKSSDEKWFLITIRDLEKLRL